MSDSSRTPTVDPAPNLPAPSEATSGSPETLETPTTSEGRDVNELNGGVPDENALNEDAGNENERSEPLDVSRTTGWLLFSCLILCALFARHILGLGSSTISGHTISGQSAGSHEKLGQFRLDLNSATPAQLQALPEVGPRLANRIVLYRTEQGPFTGVDELMEVRGIGPATMQNLRSMLRIDRDALETGGDPAP